MNSNFTVLRLDQIIGPNQLDVFKRYGTESAPSMYAVRRGVEDFILKGKYYAAKNMEVKGTLLDKACCEYWTSTRVEGSIAKCYAFGKLDAIPEAAWSDNNGIRLVVPLDVIKDKITDSYTIQGEGGDVKVVVYGEYPQDVLKTEEKYEMNAVYNDGEAKPTGKTYSAVGYKTEMFYDGNERHFERDEYPEYEYKGEKYVLGKNAYFHNGDSRFFWAKVQPIEWIVDEESGLAITKDCIVGGVPISRKGVYLGNFDKTLVQDFIDSDLVDDFTPSKTGLKTMITESEATYEDEGFQKGL